MVSKEIVLSEDIRTLTDIHFLEKSFFFTRLDVILITLISYTFPRVKINGGKTKIAVHD